MTLSRILWENDSRQITQWFYQILETESFFSWFAFFPRRNSQGRLEDFPGTQKNLHILTSYLL